MNRLTQSPRRLRSVALLLAALLLVQLVTACVLGGNAPIAAQEALAAGATGDDFETQLRAAIAAQNYTALAELMSDPFRLAYFTETGRMITPAEAVEELELDILGPAANPFFDDVTDVDRYFGVATTTGGLWGDAIDVTDTLTMRGLGADGLAEALLAIADVEGEPRWGGMLVAREGFGLPPYDPSLAPPTEESEEGDEAAEPESSEMKGATGVSLAIVRTTNVYPAPDPEAAPLGLLRPGQSVETLGLSDDGEYYRIVCPAALNEEECWVVADPGAVETLAGAVEPEGTPDSEPQPQPTAPPLSGQGGRPERISFEQGAVSATREGVVTPDAPVYYVVRAQAGQSMSVEIASDEGAANFSITGVANGQPYKAADDGQFIWSFTVPATQDYLIAVEAGAETEYTLTVVVPPLGSQPEPQVLPTVPPPAEATVEAIPEPTVEPTAEPTAEPTPEPTVEPTAVPTEDAETEAAEEAVAAAQGGEPESITFPAGATSAVRTGTVSPEQGKQFIFAAAAGQSITLALVSGGDVATFAVVGVDDGVLYKGMDVAGAEFTFESPADQEYIVTLDASVPTIYALTLTIPALEESAIDEPAEEEVAIGEPSVEFTEIDGLTRLRVPAGGTSVSVVEIVTQYSSDRYIVRALEGQTMSVVLASPESIANFSVIGYDDRATLKGLDDPARSWSGVLPATQDYVITVENPRGVRVQYALDVEFSPLEGETPVEPEAIRIRLPLGGTAATVRGSLAPDTAALYVLGAQAGQTMDAVLVADGPAYFTIYGEDGTVLISPMAGASEWSGVLPLTQDYFISVRGQVGADLVYALTVRFSPLAAGEEPSQPNTPPERIRFTAGAISAMVSGSVPANGVQSYVLAAQEGQTLGVELYPTAAAVFSVSGADGTVLKSSGAGGTSWSGTLPATQDYTITIFPQDEAIEFDLIVTIPS